MIPGVWEWWVWIYINLSNNNAVSTPKSLAADTAHTVMITGLTPTVNLLNNPSGFLKKRSPSPRVSKKSRNLSIVLAESPEGCALPGCKLSRGVQLQIICRVM